MDGGNTQEGNVQTNPSHPSLGLRKEYSHIPVDYFKAELIGVEPEEVAKGLKMDLIPVLKEGGEIVCHYLKYQNLKLKYHPSGRTFISGSLHRFYNGGGHNYNDFNEESLSVVVKRLKRELKIKPENLRLIGLEFGLNVRIDFDVDDLLDHLLFHKRVEFVKPFNGVKGHYLQAEHGKYILKIYNKGKQFQLPENVLRIEVKQTNWSEYRLGLRIVTLQDFIEADKRVFIDKLLTRWDEVLLYDYTLNGVGQWVKYRDVNTWRELFDKSDKTIKKHVDRLNGLILSSSENRRKAVMERMIININSLQGVRNDKRKVKRCRLTGFDISTQREDSFLLSHTGLKNLIQSKQNDWIKLKQKYLSSKWRNESLEIQIKEVAHVIRTRFNYKQNHTFENQLTLFLEG